MKHASPEPCYTKHLSPSLIILFFKKKVEKKMGVQNKVQAPTERFGEIGGNFNKLSANW